MELFQATRVEITRKDVLVGRDRNEKTVRNDQGEEDHRLEDAGERGHCRCCLLLSEVCKSIRMQFYEHEITVFSVNFNREF